MKATIALCLTITLAAAATADAFHSGSAGECEGCHTMHNSSDGNPVVSTLPQFQTGRYLLKGSDASSVCLNCHEKPLDPGPTTYHVSTPSGDMPAGVPPKQMTPGGDFGWLKKSFSWIAGLGSSTSVSTGDSHGHNIVAADYGYLADAAKPTAPGGTYPASNLTCISCHDPHGRYRRNADGSVTSTGKPVKDSGSYETSPEPDGTSSVGTYRLLGGTGYYPKSLGAGIAFSANPPAAVAPSSYNRAEDVSGTRVAYGSGMSEWCRNCHPYIHSGSDGTMKHPAGSGSGVSGGSGRLTSDITAYYSQYVKTGDLTGTESTAYLSLAPFEVGTSTYPTLKSIVATTPTKGPSTSDGAPAVMCLSCHRAHASGWSGSMRWNSRAGSITYNGKYSQTGETFQPYGQGRSEMEAAAAYYNKPASSFATQQQGLCYKCHVNGQK